MNDIVSRMLGKLGKRSPVLEHHYGRNSSLKKRLAAYTTDALTSKMWIFPDGRVTACTVMHYQWLLSNKDICAKYGIPIDKLPAEEGPIRIAALLAGFVRVNYEHKGGLVTFEAMADKLTETVKNSIMSLVLDNAGDIYYISVHLLNGTAKNLRIKGDRIAQVFTYDDEDKVNHIPYVTEAIQRHRLSNARRSSPVH